MVVDSLGLATDHEGESNEGVTERGSTMRVSIIGTMCLATILAAGLARAQTPTPTPIDCEAVRCQVQGTISSCLTGAKNHGQCVSCVAHAWHDPSIRHQVR